ncbi:acyl-CoA dehydrogenase family protein [Xanthobacteraceae bacterium A53D]
MSGAALLAVDPAPWAAVCEMARAHADMVDRDGRYPAEAVTAMQASGALALGIPAARGGRPAGMATLARMACELGACCASSAMVFAMHHNQLACLVRHGDGAAWQEAFLARVAREGLLLASVTSEDGIGGRLRTSRCAIEPSGDGSFRLEKAAPTISYGAQADAFLVTARRSAEADPGDQVLAVLLRADVTLEARGGWDALGMRGTASAAFHLVGTGAEGQILPVSFGEIAARTMVPTAHILWGAVWLGIAGDVAARCRAFLRARMRGQPEAGAHGLALLAEMTGLITAMEAQLRRAIALYEEGGAEEAATEIILLKTQLSETALRVANMGLRLCGFSAYRNDTPYSLGRHLRDLQAGPLMVSNDAILGDAGRLLLATRQRVGQFDAVVS